jgi:anaerobic selenocysteine-containing dehydrogenase
MCPAGCGIIAHVEGARVVKITPDPDDLFSAGYICRKGLAGTELLYNPDRLKHPMIRTEKNGAWKRATWDEALDFAAERLDRVKRETGPEAIAVYRGQAGGGLGAIRDYIARFMNLLGSPNRAGPGYICRAPRALAARVTYGVQTEPSWENTDCAVIWAMSATHSKGCNGKHIADNKRRGSTLIVVDPVKTELAEIADLWIRPRYGTDCWLALAALNVVIEEGLYDADFVARWCTGWDEMARHVSEYTPESVEGITGVSSDQTRRLARLYAQAPRSYIADGNGIDQQVNSVQTARAIALLRMVMGKFDIEGGEKVRVPFPRKPLRLANRLPRDTKPLGGYTLAYGTNGEIPVPEIVDAILQEEPHPVRAFMVQGANPAVVTPNSARARKALEEVEFLLVHDIFMTRTAQYADVLLPSTTYLESFGMTSVGTRTRYLRLQAQAVEPMYEARPDAEVWMGLGRRLFPEYFAWRDTEQLLDEDISPTGYTVRQVVEQPVVFPEERQKHLTQGFKTPSGKVEFVASEMIAHGYDGLPRPVDSRVALGTPESEYPLICSNWPYLGTYTHSAQRNIPSLRKAEPDPVIRLHPAVAAAYGVQQGDVVVIENSNGSVSAACAITDKSPPGAVTITWGWGEAVPEADIGSIVFDHVRDPVIGSISSRFIPCRIRKG